MDKSHRKILCPFALRQRDKHLLFCAKMRDAGIEKPECPHVWRCPGDMLLYNSNFSGKCPLIAKKAEEPKPSADYEVTAKLQPENSIEKHKADDNDDTFVSNLATFDTSTYGTAPSLLYNRLAPSV